MSRELIAIQTPDCSGIFETTTAKVIADAAAADAAADFRSKLAGFAPEFKDISYQDAVDAVGLVGISAAIITVTGADGNYIG